MPGYLRIRQSPRNSLPAWGTKSCSLLSPTKALPQTETIAFATHSEIDKERHRISQPNYKFSLEPRSLDKVLILHEGFIDTSNSGPEDMVNNVPLTTTLQPLLYSWPPSADPQRMKASTELTQASLDLVQVARRDGLRSTWSPERDTQRFIFPISFYFDESVIGLSSATASKFGEVYQGLPK